MPKLFVSKLPKSVPADEVEGFLEGLFPDATHIQLLRGSYSGSHKGHAYAHFASEVAAADALHRLGETSPPTLHGETFRVRRGGRVEATDKSVISPQPLPPQLADHSYSLCACVSPSLADTLDDVVDRCQLSRSGGGAVAVVFATEERATAAVMAHRGRVALCLPPLLPQLLSSRAAKRRRREREEDGADDNEERDPGDEEDEEVEGEGEGGDGDGDVVVAYERHGLVPVSPAQALLLVRELMEGRGRIAVKDRKGHVAVLNLPAHATALE
ncbi:hypothetical protein DQ04_00221120 [Trypanosoma grayi]|uniref:hypothetical protein n=1 Tax=Trypanosoma grayi TaxID=71804 RepID=UPI0004F4A0A6|nr:hypothetical protein DQ04_00221120 [Trypanosoma grayi]KEG15009.1 hypothetical protein DQ04_00221120 [Trypanosoma grayi]